MGTRPTRKLGLYEAQHSSTAYQNCKRFYCPNLKAPSSAQFRRMLNLKFHLSASLRTLTEPTPYGSFPHFRAFQEAVRSEYRFKYSQYLPGALLFLIAFHYFKLESTRTRAQTG